MQLRGRVETAELLLGPAGRRRSRAVVVDVQHFRTDLVRILVKSMPGCNRGSREESWWRATFGRVVVVLDRVGPGDSPPRSVISSAWRHARQSVGGPGKWAPI